MDSITTAVNLLYLILFVVGLFIASVRIGVRLYSFLKSNRTVPRLLKRDFVFFAGLAVPFLGIFLARATGLGPIVAGQLWWTILTGTPALIGLYYFIYYEFFVIESDI